jgi:hypothetical protein
MLRHYTNLVDEIHVVVYEWSGFSTYDSVKEIVSKFSNANIVRREIKEQFNWEYVTQLYNEVKAEYPNDWWVVSDDDEFHSYSKPLHQIISECDTNGWELVRGGFIDRIGLNGVFEEIKEDINIFQQFPMAGFFRYPLSGACPNKICIVKGNIEITPGQHYAKIDGQTTWRWQGWNHPLIAPVNEYNVQVHHFKWDSTCIDRIKSVADIKKDYAFSDEYLKMYQALRRENFQIPIDDVYMFEHCVTEKYEDYKNWNKLFKKIISI